MLRPAWETDDQCCATVIQRVGRDSCGRAGSQKQGDGSSRGLIHGVKKQEVADLGGVLVVRRWACFYWTATLSPVFWSACRCRPPRPCAKENRPFTSEQALLGAGDGVDATTITRSPPRRGGSINVNPVERRRWCRTACLHAQPKVNLIETPYPTPHPAAEQSHTTPAPGSLLLPPIYNQPLRVDVGLSSSPRKAHCLSVASHGVAGGETARWGAHGSYAHTFL